MKHLRSNAEKVVPKEEARKDVKLTPERAEQLIHELELHQVELEMQNDELKISRLEIEKSRQHFTVLFDLAPSAYFLLNTSGIIEKYNRAAKTLLKKEHVSIRNRRLHAFVHEADTDAFYKFMMRLKKTSNKETSEFRMRISADEVVSVHALGTVIKINEDTSQFYICLTDLTESKKAEQQLKEINERFEVAMEASSAGTWSINIKTLRVTGDERKAALYGLSESFNKSYKEFLKIVHPGDRDRVDKVFKEALERKGEVEVEYRAVLPDESIRYLLARGRTYTEDGRPVKMSGIVVDISEKKKVDELARKIENEYQKGLLKAVLKSQEQERSRISEALHNSIGQTLYALKLNIDAEGDSDYRKKNLLLLEQAIKESRNISFELSPSILKDFGLSITISEMVKRLENINLEISTRISGFENRPSELMEVTTFRIVQELVNNMLKYAHATECSIDVSRKGGKIKLIVKDNGTGFPQQDAKFLSKGTGISYIKNRLRLFNGDMHIDSSSEGTQVTITMYEEKL